MKYLVNIILLIGFISCNAQDRLRELEQEHDSIVDLYRLHVEELLTNNTKLQSTVDSLGLVIDSLGVNEMPPGVFVAQLDTAYIYVSDTLGNSIEVRKNGSQINTITSKDTLRITTHWTTDRNVFYMNDNKTAASMVEDSTGYTLTFKKEKLTLRKRK